MASASGPSASSGNGGAHHGAGPSESNWNVVDPGPSQTLNGWDDPVDGWELQPSYNNNPYNGDNNNLNNNNNGKACWETMSSSSGSFTKVKSRKGAGSVSSAPAYSESRRGGGQRQGTNRNNGNNGNPNANANSDRTSPRQQQGGGGGGGSRGSRGRGKSFNGGRGGAAAAAKGFAWGQHQNARQYEDYSAPVPRAWETAAAVNGSPENGWQQFGSTKSRNGSESLSRSAPGSVNNNSNNNTNSNPNNAKAWHQGARAASTQLVSAGSSGNSLLQGVEGGNADGPYEYPASPYSDSQCSDLDHVDDDSDDALFFSDDSYTQETHEEQKKIKWFRDFFQDLDGMTDGQCTEHDRQWHCPACKGGPGAIDWFRGLVPLATHARTMRSRRVKLHRKFAEVLEEELRIRRSGGGNGGVDAGGATPQLPLGKWKGLSEETEAQQQLLVIWPPIVVIQNTQLEQDDEGRWVGMGNRELVDMFKDYNPLKPRHAYGPQGHRGMSLLIFSDSPAGYHDAVRLGNHFVKLRRGKDDWNRPSKLLFRPGGNRILYGYLAVKEDLDIFNRHSRGKTLVRYEVRRLQEVVVESMQRMEQENQQMQSLQSEHNTLKKTVSKTSKNLQLREEELQVLRERAEKQHLENKRQLADMEEFFQMESAQWADEVASKDTELQKLRDDFDKMYLSRCQELNAQRSSLPDNQEQQNLMADDIEQKTKKVEGSLLEAQDFENKLKELEQKHHERRVLFQKQQHEAALAFEQQIKSERTEFLHSFEKQMQIR